MSEPNVSASADTIDVRVLNSIALLDERGPEGWRDKLRPHLDTLKVHSIRHCPLSLIYNRGSFSRALDRLFPRRYTNGKMWEEYCTDTRKYAFWACPDDTMLTQHWVRAIREGL